MAEAKRAGFRILIDALAARYGGNAYATASLALALAGRPDVESVALVARVGSIVERSVAGGKGIETISLPAVRHAELVGRTIWQSARLPVLARRGGWHLMISVSGIVPVATGVPVLCLLGNALMYESDHPADRMRRWAVRRTARRPRVALAAPTDTLARLVTASTGRRCATLPHGVDRSIFYPADSAGGEVLCVADFYAHKRHDLVLDAWERLRPPRPRLRLIGDPSVDEAVHRRVRKQVTALDEAHAVTIDGVVPHGRMGAVYRRAGVLVVASEHESFCLPVAEAMACGVPVLTRDIASVRETAGGGAMFVRGDSRADWGAALGTILDGRGPDRETALAAASRYSWDRAADQVLEAAGAIAPRR